MLFDAGSATMWALAARMASRRAIGQCPRPVNAENQERGGARAWKRRCGNAAKETSRVVQNRTRPMTTCTGNPGAAAGTTEAARFMTAQMAQ
jgi:hypothetical protein